MAHARTALDRAHELVAQEGVEAEEEILEGSAGDRVVELARARNAPLRRDRGRFFRLGGLARTSATSSAARP